MLFKIACVLFAVCLTYAEGSLFMSAFNVQVFGKSKMSKEPVVEKLVDIILRYDMTIIQEIRDIDEIAFPQLVDRVNLASGGQYSSLLSPRSGRTSSKEQYGYIYKTSKLRVVQAFEFPDNQQYGDIFEREPFVVTFEDLQPGAVQQVFNTIMLHAKPDDAVSEVSALAEVYDYATIETGIADTVILGDLNADCSYITASEWPQVRLFTEERFTWKIPNSADTTVSTTDCAYDRIVTAGSATANSYGAAVFNFEEAYKMSYTEARDVSDHYPVEFYLN